MVTPGGSSQQETQARQEADARNRKLRTEYRKLKKTIQRESVLAMPAPGCPACQRTASVSVVAASVQTKVPTLPI